MFCPNCGQSLAAGSKFCSVCGRVLPTVVPREASQLSPSDQAPSHEEMAIHVKVLAWLHLIFGALGSLVGILIFAFFLIAGMGLSRSMDVHTLPYFLPVPAAVGALLAGLALLLSLPAMIAGFGLLKYRNWARILTIVLCIFNLINFPFGTVLGAYGLWILLSRRGEVHYRQRTAAF